MAGSGSDATQGLLCKFLNLIHFVWNDQHADGFSEIFRKIFSVAVQYKNHPPGFYQTPDFTCDPGDSVIFRGLYITCGSYIKFL